MKRSGKRKKRKQNAIILFIIATALVTAAVLIICIITNIGKTREDRQLASSLPVVEQNESKDIFDSDATDNTDIIATATIGATGDILTHNKVLYSAFDGYENYDFTNNFRSIQPYWSALDYMIVNLEVPCGGSQGEKGNQYPTFDAPDSIIYGLKDAGVDMFLTASNHSFDANGEGLLHTQKVINSVGADHVGTRLNSAEKFYLIREINKIKFGMACYTYDTRDEISDRLSLNTIPAEPGCEELVNTFCYSDAGLEELYANVKSDLNEMDQAGCDVKILFMHWGTEYMDAPSDFIKEIAQHLCDLGVDVIVGGHPHVIQPFEVLEGTSGNVTYCLYSTGNCISSQRKEIMNEDNYRGYTEDGVTMSLTFNKYSDGKTALAGIYMLPTWVDEYDFSVIPLDGSLSPGEWMTVNTEDAIASYNRTLGRIGEKYPNLRSELGQEDIIKELQ